MSCGLNEVYFHEMAVNQTLRAERCNQTPALLWFTGLSGAGKSTLANALDAHLFALGYHTYVLDGDNLRRGLCADLGFSERDRQENMRRVGAVAGLMMDAGLIVLASFISPFQQDRQGVRTLIHPGKFVEIFVDTPLAVCEARDVKGLYAKARQGEIRAFTGISSSYEAPTQPDITVNTAQLSVQEAVTRLFKALHRLGILTKIHSN